MLALVRGGENAADKEDAYLCSRSMHTLSGDMPTRWRLLRTSLSGLPRDSFDLHFAVACWEIWKERNSRLFNNHQSSIVDLEDRVVATAILWASSIGV